MRTEEEAVAMIDPRNLDTLLHPQFDAAELKKATPIGKGLGASPELHVVRSYSPQKMQKNGMQEERELFWYVWRPLPKISPV